MFLRLLLISLILCTSFGTPLPEAREDSDERDNARKDDAALNGSPRKFFNHKILVTPFLTSSTSTSSTSRSSQTFTPAPVINSMSSQDIASPPAESPTSSSFSQTSALSSQLLLSIGTKSSSSTSSVAAKTQTASSTSSLLPTSSIVASTAMPTITDVLPGLVAPAEVTSSTISQRATAKTFALGGIGPRPASLNAMQTPDPAQFGIGPPPPGFRAPAKKKPLKNTDLDSAPF